MDGLLDAELPAGKSQTTERSGHYAALSVQLSYCSGVVRKDLHHAGGSRKDLHLAGGSRMT